MANLYIDGIVHSQGKFIHLTKEDIDYIKQIIKWRPLFADEREVRAFDFRARALDHLIEQNRKELKKMPIGKTEECVLSSTFTSTSNEEYIVHKRLKDVMKRKYPNREYTFFQQCDCFADEFNASGCAIYATRNK